MISIDLARELLDFEGSRHTLPADVAREQLEGAVAIHNILEKSQVAYLADEVGMGKTYVALGVLALFRHFDPRFRVLIIAPRRNIQDKWIKETRNFVRNNVRLADLRVRAVHGGPARPLVSCGNLIDLVREVSVNPDRDFFSRLTSFSLPVGRDEPAMRRLRGRLLEHVPHLNPALFDLRNRQAFKDNFARAVCTALPVFDLVIIDEGHNLKHGFGAGVSARNRVLALALGHPSESDKTFRGYGPRAKRVLFLSATPIEDDYRQLWNQCDVVGRGDSARDLIAKGATDAGKRECARNFLIRRVTSLTTAGKRLTKNLYRREWRAGGLKTHDDPLEIVAKDRTRQRLVVALIQKKVCEVLGSERFNNSFQIGMLASFESFLETARLKPKSGEILDTFDDPDQAEERAEKDGLDVKTLNVLAQSYRRQFGKELPHPKMDALVERLARQIPAGEKALVFVRRVASVKELQAKLTEQYDQQLFAYLRAELAPVTAQLEKSIDRYKDERANRSRALRMAEPEMRLASEEGDTAPLIETDARDFGGLDSFFSWFFRGEGPEGVLSGAALQRRFGQAKSAYSTFFDDNYAAWLLKTQPGKAPGSVFMALAAHLGRDATRVHEELAARAREYLPAGLAREALGRRDLFQAVQHGALALLAELSDEVGERARVLRQILDADKLRSSGVSRRDSRDFLGWLEEPTFFSRLRESPDLREQIWPEPKGALGLREAFREQEVRRELLSSMARLGHSFIDLYVLAIRRIGDLRLRAKEGSDDRNAEGTTLSDDFVTLLESQRENGAEVFRAFHELSAAAENFELILDVNFPQLRSVSLGEVRKTLGQALGRQQPIGGMFGEINPTLVRQFRMPGYPFVLFTTDLLQEGEDLHTFCSSVHHYGIAWMPSSMEQRVGRIDRVNSATERRLRAISVGERSETKGEDKLQVFYPYLSETVEVLQVRRVLERLNRFIRLMHSDLGTGETEERRIDVSLAALKTHWDIEPILEPLKSAFPVQEEWLRGDARGLAVSRIHSEEVLDRFLRLGMARLAGMRIEWEQEHDGNALFATAWIGNRGHRFVLSLRSIGGRLLLQCTSPLGELQEAGIEEVARACLKRPVHLMLTDQDDRRRGRFASITSKALLGRHADDERRAAWLIASVTAAAHDIKTGVMSGTDPDPEDTSAAFKREYGHAD